MKHIHPFFQIPYKIEVLLLYFLSDQATHPFDTSVTPPNRDQTDSIANGCKGIAGLVSVTGTGDIF